VIADYRGDDKSHGWIEPIPAAGEHDDRATGRDTAGGSRVSGGIEQHAAGKVFEP
jgi:hypothetical protein